MAGGQTSVSRDFTTNMLNRMSAIADWVTGGRGVTTKHDHYLDFGWPANLQFDQFYRMYQRNGLGAAAIEKTIGRTWQDMPTLWESDKPTESVLEREIRKRFDELRVWHAFADADRRSLVGRYAGIIIQFADGKRFDEPVEKVPGGLDGVLKLIPAWEDQLRVLTFDEDTKSQTYGEPSMFEFNEGMRVVTGSSQRSPRRFNVHPSRVMIWSDDGTVFGRSALEAGYNDLIDAEKVKGAGGEGFWKNARGAPVIEAPEGIKPKDVAKAMNVSEGEMLDKVNEQVEQFASGFDKALLLGGMTAKPMNISLAEPEHFFLAPVQCFAASMQIPLKILMGSQTGERASTEDTREWNQVNMSRRTNRNRPLIAAFVRRLVSVGIIPQKDWTVGWADLTESTAAEKLQRAKDLSLINQQQSTFGEIPFPPDEIREAAGYKALANYKNPTYDDTNDDNEVDDSGGENDPSTR